MSILCCPFILLYICANSDLSSLSMVAASHCCRRGLSLKYCVWYVVQDTVATADILYSISWVRRFPFWCSYVGDRYISIKINFIVLLIGTLLTFSSPLYLILSSQVSTASAIVVLGIYFLTYPTSASSFHIYFPPHHPMYIFVPIILPLYHISATAVSISLCLNLYIWYHPFPPSMSSCVSNSDIFIKLILP